MTKKVLIIGITGQNDRYPAKSLLDKGTIDRQSGAIGENLKCCRSGTGWPPKESSKSFCKNYLSPP